MRLDGFLLLIVCALVIFSLVFVLADSSYKENQLQGFCKEQFGYSSEPAYRGTFWSPDSCKDVNGTKRPVEYYNGNWII